MLREWLFATSIVVTFVMSYLQFRVF